MIEDLEPKLEEDWVRIQYWKCYVLGHRHRTKKAAASCMLKRKGEAGELKKLSRNISMIKCLMTGTTIQQISMQHNCSSPNVTKAVNSSLNKAWRFSKQHGGCPYAKRSWTPQDFMDATLSPELNFLMDILTEMEVKLEELLK